MDSLTELEADATITSPSSARPSAHSTRLALKRGLGTAALRLLPDWVRENWRGATRVVLSVDEENASAIRSYLKAGWRDDDVRLRGRIGWERRMTLELDNGG